MSNEHPDHGTVALDVNADEAMAANLQNWDARVPLHTAPGGYIIDPLVDDPVHISKVVAFGRERLGDLTGLDVVHLQCHIGTDTVSLAKLGANISGLDFSADAIAAAQSLATRCGFESRFVVANLYDAAEALGRTYDMVYTGVGALNWLPDIARWAETVAALVAPGGRLYLFEQHPMLGTLDDDAQPDALHLRWPYFETEHPMMWVDESTYGGEGVVESPRMYEWAHGLGEVVQAVLDAGLQITALEEHRVLPWEMLDWMEPVEGADPDWRQMPEHLRNVMPMSYELEAIKPT